MYLLAPSVAAALLDGLFEHPASDAEIVRECAGATMPKCPSSLSTTYCRSARRSTLRECGGQRDRFDETAGIGNAFADDVEGRAVIDRRADDRQPHCEVHTGAECDQFERN